MVGCRRKRCHRGGGGTEECSIASALAWLDHDVAMRARKHMDPQGTSCRCKQTLASTSDAPSDDHDGWIENRHHAGESDA
jgi:hypothetical protein